MVAEIVCVGTELLLGDIVNTNSQHISKEHAVYRLNSDNIPLAAYSVLGYSYNRIFL